MSLVFDAARARAAGLVQLPRSVQGAACNNCQFFRYEPQARDRSIGYCSHFRMTMNVMADWHCDMWKRPDAPLASPPGRQAGLGQRFARSLVQRYSRGAGGGSRAAAGSRLSSTDLVCQRAGGDLRIVDLAPIPAHIRRFARAGDADDCGHERHGGLFTPKNTCAAGGSGRQVGTLPPPRHALSPLGDESDRRLIDAAKRLIEAKADAQAAAQEPRKRSLPSPSVMSPGPFEPDEPIRRRIANLPGARKMLAEIVDQISPHHDRMKNYQANLEGINHYLLEMMHKDYNNPKIDQALATRDQLMDSIDSAREKMSEVISSLTGHNKDIKFKSVDGLGDWDGEAGRKRHQALEWLQSTVAGRGDVKVKWNTDEEVLRPGAVTQTLPYEIDVNSIASDTKVYVHEMGHVIERSVAGVHEAAREFLEYRTRNTPDLKMKEFHPDRNYGDNEIGNEDDFGNAYIGKKYPEEDEMTEIVSMGLQFLYDDPVYFAQADPEYCTFILGILRGDLRSPSREHKFS